MNKELDGSTPLARFQKDLLKIQPLGELAKKLDEYFYHRIKRVIKKDGTLSYEGLLFEVPFEFVGQTVYLVVEAPTQTAKYIESLEHQWLGHVYSLDKQAHNHRTRQRPKASLDAHLPEKTFLVEKLYQQELKQYNTTGEK